MDAPTDTQIALFAAVEDIQELTGAITVLLTDANGDAVAVAGDEADFPAPLRAVLGGKMLAEAGSVRELLSRVDLAQTTLNVAVHAVASSYVLAILFDADADFSTVQSVGTEAREMLGEILTAQLN